MGLINEITFDIEYNFEDYDTELEENNTCSSSDEALIACVNRFGRADADYISALTRKSSYTLLFHDLRGSVFQDPDLFKENDVWSPDKGWILRDQYLCGNIMAKLEKAKEANTKFPELFSENIHALLQVLPGTPDTDEIHVSLGATWIPVWIYEGFVKDLLKLREPPSIHYESSLSKWTLRLGNATKESILSSQVYGTPDLSAFRIIEQSMNAKTVKVYDYIHHYDGKVESILNQAKTVAAQEKQKLIIQRFDEWIHETLYRRVALQENYCSSYAGMIGPQFDGSFLQFPDMNPDIHLYPHQKNAIARILLSNENVLLAHPVGAGKTFEMIGAAHELKRMGLSKKNMIVVPNSILESTAVLHRQLYPNDSFLVVYPKDFIPAKRNNTLQMIKNGDYVCVYMAYSSFDMVVMSKSYWIAKRQREIDSLQHAASNCSDKHEKVSLESEAAKKKRSLSKFVIETPECPWLTFDMLGINTLFVDEAHNYKNIEFHSQTDNIVGMHHKGSRKCREMLEKCHFVDRLIFATGTPLTNSLADLYVMQIYLQEKDLRFRNIDSFDMWINTFGERETNYEIDIDGKSLRPVTRFSSFHNLTELMSLFSVVCDFAPDVEESCIPHFEGYTDIIVPISRPQKEYIQFLAKRTELCRSHKVNRCEDNPLRITIHGYECGLDIRMVNTKEAKIFFTNREIAHGKIHYCASNTYSLYEKYPGTCQVIFCDIGTPKDGFNVYDVLKQELVNLGISPGEIEFIHSAKSESSRSELFQSINSGKIRVIIGSTPKLGIGVNVQEKLIALHHLSVPWRPADMVQREGRILRRGNTCDEVYIFRYITEGCFDSYSWQLLENKQRFIASFLSGSSASRDREDIADTVLSYAEVKALAIGNPLIKKRVETSNRIDRERIACRQRQKQLSELRMYVDQFPEKQKKLKQQCGSVLLDIKLYQKKKSSVPLSERYSFGEELSDALAQNILQPAERLFDKYQGFDVILPSSMVDERQYVIIRGISRHPYYVKMDGAKILGYSKRIDYFLEHLPDLLKSLEQKIQDNMIQYQEATTDIEADNPHLKEIDILTKELAQIDKDLCMDKEETA